MNSNYTKNQDLGLERQYVNSLENELLIDKRMCAKKASLNLGFIEGLKTPSPLLSRAFAYRESTGIGCLPVDSNNPMHKPLYTDPKRGKVKHREPICDSVGKPIGNRYFSRDLDIAFLAIERLNQQLYKGLIVFATVDFSEQGEIKFKKASHFTKYLREQGWKVPTMVVLESGAVKGGGITHAHIVTINTSNNESSRKRLKDILNKHATTASNAVQIKDSYVVERKYTALTLTEEIEFGTMPTTKDSEDSYWLNTWRVRIGYSDWLDALRGKNNYYYKVKLPVNGGIANYLSKEIKTGRRLSERFAVVHLGDTRGIIKKELLMKANAYRKSYMSTSS